MLCLEEQSMSGSLWFFFDVVQSLRQRRTSLITSSSQQVQETGSMSGLPVPMYAHVVRVNPSFSAASPVLHKTLHSSSTVKPLRGRNLADSRPIVGTEAAGLADAASARRRQPAS